MRLKLLIGAFVLILIVGIASFVNQPPKAVYPVGGDIRGVPDPVDNVSIEPTGAVFGGGGVIPTTTPPPETTLPETTTHPPTTQTPTVTPSPEKVEVQITLASRTCTIRERYEDGSARYWVDVSGTASGPVSTRVYAYTSDAVRTCDTWSPSQSWGCARAASEPATVEWTFRFPALPTGSIGEIFVNIDGNPPLREPFDAYC
jgi:hypothetical protein